MIVVRTDRRRNLELHRQLTEAASEVVAGLLGRRFRARTRVAGGAPRT
jgi:hypothetical protein